VRWTQYHVVPHHNHDRSNPRGWEERERRIERAYARRFDPATPSDETGHNAQPAADTHDISATIGDGGIADRPTEQVAPSSSVLIQNSALGPLSW
jgi:hypothetical protein